MNSNASAAVVTGGCDDSAFGPIVHGCRDDFDFTFAFEQYLFSIAPSAAVLLAAPVRIVLLRKRSAKVDGLRLQTAKVIAIAVFACLQLALLALWATQHDGQAPGGTRRTALAASALSLAASLALLPLSYVEHAKSLRPSLLLTAYLAASLLLDAATVRTLWVGVLPGLAAIRPVFTASFALKALLLVLEAAGKRRFFLDHYRGRSPEESSGLFGQGLLLWVNGIIFFGARHLLTPKHLYPITADMVSQGLSDGFWALWSKNEPKQKSLKLTLLRLLWWPLVLPILPRLALLAFTMCQPLMVRRLLDYLGDPVQSQDAKTGYGLIGASVFIYVGMAICTAVYWHRHCRFMAMTRGTLLTTVFRKAMEMKVSAANNAKTVTLMSADCERITRGVMDLHELWANVAQVGIATYLIETQLGVACVAPIAVTLLTTGLTVVAANYTPRFQIRWIEKIESRIAVTSSVLGSMKGIKITNLTSKVSAVLNQLRQDELAAAGNFRLISIITATIGFVPQLLSPVVTFAAFIAVAKNNATSLDATRMFTSLSLLLLVAEPLFKFFGGLIGFMTALGCLKRVEDFLLTPPHNDKRSFGDDALSQSSGSVDVQNGEKVSGKAAAPAGGDLEATSVCISVQNGSFGWAGEGDPVLRNVNFQVNSGEVVFVLGPVASGKSTLLQALLGETPFFDGKVALTHREVAFCEQSPWIMNDSIRANITYGCDFDPSLYTAVLHGCDLATDLKSLPKGDMTVVGSKGASLSAGQRQRVALGRAVYSRNKIAVLDDVFSQLDANTQVNISRRLLGPDGLFRRWGTTVVLASSSSRFLSYSDRVIVLGDKGEIAQQGKFEKLKNVHGYIRDLCKDQPENDSTEILPARDNNNDIGTKAEYELVPAETTPEAAELEPEAASGGPPETDTSVYKYYFASINWKNALLFVVLQISLAFLSSFGYVWLKWWTDDSSAVFPNARTGYYIGVYAALQGGALAASALVTWWSLNVLGVSTGFALHADLARTVTSSTLKLFTSTDAGHLLNRFTQDIQLADMQLPIALQVVTTNLLVATGQAGLIASASGWIALSYPLLAAVFYLVPAYYVRAARQLRTLDLEQKAPLYAQFLETLAGLATLRAAAFGWLPLPALRQNCELADRSQQPVYLMYVVQKWLGLVLDLAIAGLATLVVGLAVGPLRNTISPGFTGVSLTQIVSFTSYLKLLVLFWAQMQMAMSAVQRIRDFGRDTEQERDLGPGVVAAQVPADWPALGAVRLDGLSARYSNEPSSAMVINNISLDIKPGEKVCICGRTGSGKSSVVLTLLRLLDPLAGSIKIDGIDLASVPRAVVRERIAGVAEDPFFLPGTVRENMDPYGQETDDTIVQALADVGLWSAVFEQAPKGLDAELDRDMLSHGQRQLFNISRAMLRATRVLVLDEVTSSLDAQSEQVVHRLIETRLKHHTVISVIHKLDFAFAFDKVAVMDDGQVIEFDTPQALLARVSRFGELYTSQR